MMNQNPRQKVDFNGHIAQRKLFSYGAMLIQYLARAYSSNLPQKETLLDRTLLTIEAIEDIAMQNLLYGRLTKLLRHELMK